MGCGSSSTRRDKFPRKSIRPLGGDVFYPSAQYLRPEELGYEVGDCYFRGFHNLIHARHPSSNADLCMKTYPPHHISAPDMMREVTILSQLSHGCPTSFPAYKGLFVHNNAPHIVMSKHFSLGLAEVVEELNALEKLQIWNAIVDAVLYCHRHEVILCALHPDFIRVRVAGEEIRKIGYLHYPLRIFQIQITEFGGAVAMYEKSSAMDLQERVMWPHLHKQCHPFIAPELGLADDGYTLVTPQADVWSLGVLMHFMMFATDPAALLSARRDPSPDRHPAKPNAGLCASSSRYYDVIRDIEQRSPSVSGYRSLVTQMVELFPEERPDLSRAIKQFTSSPNIFMEVERYFRDPRCFSINKRFLTRYK